MENDLRIIPVEEHKKRYLSLLLLGDEQENMIDRYLEHGKLYVMKKGHDTICVCVVTKESDTTCEIKNLAVEPRFQRQGYGRRMIAFVERICGERYRTLQVGTGDGTSAVAFYEKCGFVRSHRIKNFFTDHYDKPILEDGVLLKDMVYLKKRLDRPSEITFPSSN